MSAKAVEHGKEGYDSKSYFRHNRLQQLKEKPHVLKKRDVEPYDPEHPWIKWFQSQVGGHLFANFLDIGCGYGRISQFVNAQRYVGIDIVKERIEAARKSYGDADHEFIQIDPDEAWPLEDASMSGAVMCTVLQHLELPRACTLLREAARVIRPFAKLYMWEARIVDGDDDVAEAERQYTDPSCPRHMVPKPLSALMRTAPFEWERTPGTIGWVLTRKFATSSDSQPEEEE